MNCLLLLVAGAITAMAQESEDWEKLAQQAAERMDADDLTGAEALCRDALQKAQRQLGADHPQLVSLSTQFGGILHVEGRDAEAEPVLRRALEIAYASGEARLLAIALNALGNALHGEGQAARAEPVLRRSLALFEESEGIDASDTAKAANNLATVYSDTGQYEQAEKQLNVALSFYQKHLGSFPVAFATSLRNMFVVLMAQKRMAEAESYLARAVAIGSMAFPESMKMMDLRMAQALLEARRGKFQNAAHLLKQVIATQERMRVPPRELAQSLILYSAVLRHLHQRTEARQIEKRGMLILKSLP